MSSRRHVKRVDSIVRSATEMVIERLEGRTMLTTLLGSDFFNFVGLRVLGAPLPTATAHFYRAHFGGSSVTEASAEFIGAYFNENNVPVITDIPGVITRTIDGVTSTINVNGGLQGRGGTVLYGEIRANDPVTGNNLVHPADGSADNDVRGIAVHDDDGGINANLVYGFNLMEDADEGVGQVIQVIRFDNSTEATPPPPANANFRGQGTVVADVGPAVRAAALLAGDAFNTFAEDPEDDPVGLDAVEAASFNPLDGRLYFVVRGGPEGINKLFSIDVDAGSPAAISASLIMYGGIFGATAGGVDPDGDPIPGQSVEVRSITFDQFSPTAATMYAYAVRASGGGDLGQIYTMPATLAAGVVAVTATPTTIDLVRNRNDNEVIEDITGIEFAGDDPTIEEQFLFAVTSSEGGATGADPLDIESGARMLRMDTNQVGSGTIFAVTIALVSDPTDTSDPIRGEDLQGLTWSPVLLDPITGEPGTFVASDAEHDDLVVLSFVIRPPAIWLFNIYVATSTEDTFLSVEVDPLPLPHTPHVDTHFNAYTSDSGDIPSRRPGALVNNAPAGSGVGYLGMKRGIQPITAASAFGGIGVFPGGRSVVYAGLETAGDLGRFTFGGTVTGRVLIGGSMNLFYAGWLITGNIGEGVAPVPSPNFEVMGDMRNIVVRTDTGTGGSDDNWFNSGFTLRVHNALGQFISLQSAHGSWLADNVPGTIGYDSAVPEIEERGFVGFSNANLTHPDFFNDTFETAQFVGTFDDVNITNPLEEPAVFVSGTVYNDTIIGDVRDYYAFGMTAGQTVTVDFDGAAGFLHYAIFDPDGREILTDYNNVSSGETNFEAIRFTADRPGAYRIAVSVATDIDFASTDFFFGVALGYVMTIRGEPNKSPGNYAIGGIVTRTGQITGSITAETGHIGAIHSDFMIGSDTLLVNLLVTASNGDVKNIDCLGTAVWLNAINIEAPNGYIGLVRTTGGDLGLTTLDLTLAPSPTGRDIQVIDAAASLTTIIQSNQALGTIRAANYTTIVSSGYEVPSSIGSNFASGTLKDLEVNYDNDGLDGKIDLIDIGGLLSGVSIVTNDGGDVGYINAPTVERDPFFGSPTEDNTIHDPGEVVTVEDDSGAMVEITPLGETIANPLFDPNNPAPNVLPFVGPQIQIRTYPIRDGGEVIVNITMVGTASNGSSTGVQIDSSGFSTGAKVGIGEIVLAGTGTAPLQNPITGVYTIPEVSTSTVNGVTTTLNPRLDVIFKGSANVNVLNIEAPAATISSIQNDTVGEIQTVNAANIGIISSRGSIGLNTVRNTDAAVMERQVYATAHPFLQQHNLIQASGVIVLVQADRAVGNIQANGTIQQVIANADGENESQYFEGINGPVVAGVTAAFLQGNPIFQIEGSLVSVDIGEGVLPSMSGLGVNQAGLFAGGKIYRVFSSQNNADIRGNIHSKSQIGLIELDGGSIINADILVTNNFADAAEPILGGTVSVGTQSQRTFINEIERIEINGAGGMVGAKVATQDIGPVNVDGYGIFQSLFRHTGDGQQAMVQAAGYGIRDSTFEGGTSMQGFAATSNALNIPTTNYNSSVRLSETHAFDPFFGFVPNRLTDLHAYLTTSAANPSIEGVTDGGVIEDTAAVGSRNLGTVNARQIRTSGDENVPLSNEAFPMILNFGSSIGSIITRDVINGLAVTTGKLRLFQPGNDVSGTGITIAGPINTMTIRGNFGRIVTNPSNGQEVVDSFIRARGVNGRIGTLRIEGNLVGNISAVSRINQILVDGSITGSIQIDGQTRSGNVLNLLRFGGSLGAGNLNIQGSVGTIEARGGLGLAGEQIEIHGNLASLKVGTDKNQNGSVMGLNLLVHGTAKSISVTGRIDGNITVDNNLTSLKVTAEPGVDPTTGLINGQITVGQKIGTISIKGGSLTNTVTAGFDIKSITVTDGNIIATSNINSTVGKVGEISVKRSRGQRDNAAIGHMTGGVNAPSATKLKVSVAGNIGDNVNIINFTANRFSLLKAGGSILGGTSFNAMGSFDKIEATNIDGSLLATTFAAAQFKTIKLANALFGNASMTASGSIDSLTAASIGGSTATTALTAAAFGKVKISGSILGNSTITTGGLIKSLTAGALGDDNAVDGISPLAINAGSFSKLRINGVVRSGTTVTVTGAIDSLELNGVPTSVEAGAIITAAEIKEASIAGAILGTVTPLPVA